ncbi:MAG: UDP-3-O-(3-hydroxymyristoyl)glucosamine N-acyltransferase [Pseudomonadota bacterium]
MVDRRFFINHGPFAVGDIAAATGTVLQPGADATRLMKDVAPLDRAGEQDISFFDNSKYADQFANSGAGACFVRAKYAELAPKSMIVLLSEDPYRCYALAAQKFYPHARPAPGIAPGAVIDPTATLGHDVAIASGAVIGADVVLGDRCSIGPNAVIADGVQIGDDSSIGALSSITHSIIGKRAIIHRGVHIGQDGFGFALGRDGHVKVPQLGRVIIGDDVEIGSGTTIDRGTGPDTLIGDGTKIDNLVQLGHNVQLGKRVIIVAQCGISGSTRIGDGTIIGGQVGIAGHLKIGAGVKVAAQSGVMHDLPSGGSYGGSPAIPSLEWHRQTIAVSRLNKPKRGSNE